MKQKLPRSIQDVVVADLPKSTTTSKQPHRARDDDETIAQVNFTTHTVATLVEDGLEGQSPSSFTQFFSHKHR